MFEALFFEILPWYHRNNCGGLFPLHRIINFKFQLTKNTVSSVKLEKLANL